MIIRIEISDIKISDYKNDAPFVDPKIIVQDAGPESDFVRITVGDKTVKVNANEIINAVKRCQNAQWPYQ